MFLYRGILFFIEVQRKEILKQISNKPEDDYYRQNNPNG
ncbi:hypothetical protein DSL99_3714 [Leeuwenhoekiella marinoflava]|uniref:Uncharacterized protein n=1 Tax=Leeuwenhoekiella marinoflava TaxID=988 RepID=A0A4Q0PBS8_9FLAO|nr:hypothetical protein DSL99_3714 [Leeuwenhoekiella marinoflava]